MFKPSYYTRPAPVSCVEIGLSGVSGHQGCPVAAPNMRISADLEAFAASSSFNKVAVSGTVRASPSVGKLGPWPQNLRSEANTAGKQSRSRFIPAKLSGQLPNLMSFDLILEGIPFDPAVRAHMPSAARCARAWQKDLNACYSLPIDSPTSMTWLSGLPCFCVNFALSSNHQ